MKLQSGTILQGGRYRIVDSLGRGGFGVTYLAEQVMARRKVCIKEFFPQDYYKRDEDSVSISLLSENFKENMLRFKTKFIKEAQTIAALDHPNIIHIHDVFEENGTAYYVMDYIEGESLSELVKLGDAFAEADALRYIREAASALEYIHDRNINHLDVKPGNIMVRREDNRAILIDFGLSKHYDSESGEATSTTPVGVSHGFAPMEQYQVGGVSTFSPETDIYSLGATLYYLVTGNVPPQATVVAEQGLPQLGALSSNIREAIERSMSYLRKDRPHTIKEFLALLDNVEPVVEVLVADDERTKITAVTDDEKTKIVAPQPKVEQPKVQIDREPKPKKSDWWVWCLLLLFIVVLLMSIKDLFSNGDNSKEVATKEKTEIYTTYKIGDYYNENGKRGIVFEVSDGGRHGKIVSLDETYVQWDSRVKWDKNIDGPINGTETGANNKSNGKANTDKIMDRTDSEYFEAFVWCRNKGDDWYLPAYEELEAIYNNKSAINSTLAEYGGTKLQDDAYWSSTEYNEPGAWGVDVYGGYTNLYNKSPNFYVRAVSAF